MDWDRASRRQKRRDRAPARPLGAMTEKRAAYLAARQQALKQQAQRRRESLQRATNPPRGRPDP